MRAISRPPQGGHYILFALSLFFAGCSSSTTTPSTTVTPATFVMTWNSVAFPNTGVGTTAATPLVVTLWNNGTAAVPVGTVTDSNTTEFPFTTTCQMSGSLAPGSTCTVTTGFTPNAMGAQTATLTINANSTSQELDLTGTGAAIVSPKLAITPASGSGSTLFTASVSAATPSGAIVLQTVYTPAPGNPNISFAPTSWTADASGNLSITVTSNTPGTYENWIVDVASGLASNHVAHTVQ